MLVKDASLQIAETVNASETNIANAIGLSLRKCQLLEMPFASAYPGLDTSIT